MGRLIHHLLNRHKFMTHPDGAELAICGPRWRNRCHVWLSPFPGALWEPVDDLEALKARLGWS